MEENEYLEGDTFGGILRFIRMTKKQIQDAQPAGFMENPSPMEHLLTEDVCKISVSF